MLGNEPYHPHWAVAATRAWVGAGFYTYDAPGSSTVVPDAGTPSHDGDSGSVREVARVGVVGSGTMATGIVEVFAKSGYDTMVVARTDEKAAAAKAKVGCPVSKLLIPGLDSLTVDVKLTV